MEISKRSYHPKVSRKSISCINESILVTQELLTNQTNILLMIIIIYTTRYITYAFLAQTLISTKLENIPNIFVSFCV